MYTSGCPKNQNRFSYRYWLPPWLERKNPVCAVRSSATSASVVISTGAARTFRTEVETIPQTKIGRRPKLRPGARIVKTVASMLNARSVIEMPTSAKNMM